MYKSLTITLLFISFISPVFGSEDFTNWLKRYGETAKLKGVSSTTINQAFKGLTPNPDVYKLASRQPEFTKPLWEYLDKVISKERIENGRKAYNKNKKIVDQVSKKYGIPTKYLIAIWGIESNYGDDYGDKNVIRSLATLGYQGRRKKFGRSQLLAALKILDRGDISLHKMVGSWAGAMGQTQFIPTTYEHYAVDGDRDGKRDLWNSFADVFSSTANYLKKAGWKPGETWGIEVKLPDKFNWSLTGKKNKQSMRYWRNLGVISINGSPLIGSQKAYLLLPTGSLGPAFLVFKNYQVFKRYNNADSYALAVAYLGDQIEGSKGVVAQWPNYKTGRPLHPSETIDLQKKLTRKGFNTHGIDGILGPNSKKAIRMYQRSKGLIVDGYASKALLDHVSNQRL